MGPGSDPVLKQPTARFRTDGVAFGTRTVGVLSFNRLARIQWTPGDTSSGPLVVLGVLWCSRAGVPGTAGPPFWTELASGGVAQTGGIVGELSDSTDVLPGWPGRTVFPGRVDEGLAAEGKMPLPTFCVAPRHDSNLRPGAEEEPALSAGLAGRRACSPLAEYGRAADLMGRPPRAPPTVSRRGHARRTRGPKPAPWPSSWW